MNYSDYVKNMRSPIEHKDFVSDESKPNPDKVEYSFAGIPIVKSGDKFIVFCQNFGNSYILTNGFEGLFKENGDNLENNALNSNYKLADDIAASGVSSISSSSNNTSVKNINFSKKTLISRIKMHK